MNAASSSKVSAPSNVPLDILQAIVHSLLVINYYPFLQFI